MLSPGVQLSGRYRMDERIASGGMGDVWRGTDEVLGRTVAVKVLLPALLEEPGFAERFRGEARTMANINHPGVVDVYDYGSDDAVAYLVMEYVEGDALSTTLGRVGRLTPARTMALVAQAADALHAAHEKGIVHRDVKPGNLLVRPNGTLVLTDFGIARSALVGQLTVAGSVLGTASYISPEQAAGAVATPASDVYALGVVGYQCLAGRRPFEGDSPLEIAMKHVREVAPPLPGDIPPAVQAIVVRAMAKDPPARWSSAAQLAAVARQAAATLGTPAPGPPRASRPAPPPTRPGSPAPGPVTSPAPPGHGRVSAPVPASPVPRIGPPPVLPPGSPGPMTPGGTRIAAPYPAGPDSLPSGYPRGGPGHPYPVAPGYKYPRSAPRRSTRRTSMIVVVAVLAALAVMICAGVLSYLSNQANQGNSGNNYGIGSGPTVRPGPSDLAAGDDVRLAELTYRIPCAQYQGREYDNVRAALRGSGYQVVRVDVPGLVAGRVVGVTPCRVAPGGKVSVQVATGRPGHLATDNTTKGRQTR